MMRFLLANLLLIGLACSCYGLVGGWQSVSARDSGVQKAALFATERVSERLNTPFVLKLVRVDTASYQVVAGLNYKLTFSAGLTTCMKSSKYELSSCKWNIKLGTNNAYKCSVKVFRNLSGSYDLLENKCTDFNLIDVLKERVPRNTGTYQKISTKDADVQKIADFTVARLTEDVDSIYSLKKIGVESAYRQVVAGFNYRLVVTSGFTSCLKREKHDLTLCEWNPNLKEEAEKCEVIVYVNLQGHKSLTSQKCTTSSLDDLLAAIKPKEVNMPGGWFQMKTTDKKVQRLAQVAISDISLHQDSIYTLKLVQIVKAAYQVVAGMKYKLVLDYGESQCLKITPLVGCGLRNVTHCNRCTVEIVTVPWLHTTTVGKPHSCRVVEIDASEQENNLKDWNLFQEFKKIYGKDYKSVEEEAKRYTIFRENQKFIALLRSTEKGTGQYGNTIHADLTRDEFKAKYLGYNPSLRGSLKLPDAKIPKMASTPKSFDWREKKVVTEVKNQGSCGSCWAFSTTGNIEGQWAIKKKQLVSLSEQELVDCDKVDLGCGGGLPSTAYKQIIKLGGLETEKQYPYEGEGEKCSFSKQNIKVYINSSVAISKNETEMAQWLVKNGPISIGINAMAMQFYFGGVSHPWKIFCNPASLDHGVLIVGYGVETSSILHRTLPFWIIKNSWGATWGEQGYYRVYRGDGTCGLNTDCTSAVIN